MAMQNNPAYGLGKAIGFGWESTYGTEVSPTVWWPSVSFGVTPGDPPLPHAGPTGKTSRFTYDATRPRLFRGTPGNAGTFVVEAEYDDIGVLLSNAIAAPTSTDNTGGTNEGYAHVFTLPHLPTALTQSFTLVSYEPGNSEANPPQNYNYAGCMIDSLEISATGEQIVQVSADVVAQSYSRDTDSHSPSYSAANWIRFHHTVVRYDATVGNVPNSSDDQTGGRAASDWTFRMENGLRRAQAAGGGVRGIREPIAMGYRTATLSFSRDYFNEIMRDKALSSTDAGMFASFSVYADSGTLISAGTQNYDLDIWFPAGLVTGEDPTHGGGPDIIGETVTVEATYGGSSDTICQVTLNNNTTNAAGAAYKGSQS